ESPAMARLIELDLSGNYLTYQRPLDALRGAPPHRRLTTLRLAGCSLKRGHLDPLAEATCLPRLARLHLDENWPGPRGLDMLAAGPLLGELRVLTVQGPGSSSWPERKGVWVGDRGAQALASSPRLARLVWLDLGHQQIGDKGAKALASSPHLAELRTLHL